MSFLNKIKKPSVKPPIITLVGGAGVGKTTLAATFPNPVFIQAEDAETVFQTYKEEEQPSFFPLIQSPNSKRFNIKEQILSNLRDLITEQHEFKTVVIDSVTALNLFFEQEILLDDNQRLAKAGKQPVTNIADTHGGFHKGYQVLKGFHLDLFKACQALRDMRGITVVFLAHTGTERIKHDPSETSEYHLFSLNMHKDSAKIYIDNSDAVIFMRHEMLARKYEDGDKKSMAKSKVLNTGTRQLIYSGDGEIGFPYAKNRFGLSGSEDISHRENPLLTTIPFFNNKQEI